LANRNVHVIPGISAFQAASAVFKEALTVQEDRMMLLPATDMNRVEAALAHCETLVLYKVGPRIDALCALLEQKGKAQDARLVCYAEDAVRQYTTRSLRQAQNDTPGYMSTVIVHLNRCGWKDVALS
jgi:precorrin-2/cobalt-factor-2 C20-methyltransferase